MNTNNRIIAVAEWLVKCDTLLDKLKYFHSMGFNAVSFLDQFFMGKDSLNSEIIKFLKKKNFIVLVHGNFDRPYGKFPSEAEIKAIQNWIEDTGINIWAMNFDAINKPDFDLEGTVKGLNYAFKELHPYGVKVGFENWVSNSKLDTLYRIRDNVVSQDIGMLMDLGHLNLFKDQIFNDGMTIEEYIKKIPFKIIEIHVSDNYGKGKGQVKDEDDLHLPPGKGSAPIVEFIKILENNGFNGVITLEYKGCDLNSKDCREELNNARKIISGAKLK